MKLFNWMSYKKKRFIRFERDEKEMNENQLWPIDGKKIDFDI